MTMTPTEKKVLQHLPAVANVVEIVNEALALEHDAAIAVKVVRAAFDELKNMFDALPVTKAVADQHFEALRASLKKGDDAADQALHEKFDISEKVDPAAVEPEAAPAKKAKKP